MLQLFALPKLTTARSRIYEIIRKETTFNYCVVVVVVAAVAAAVVVTAAAVAAVCFCLVSFTARW